MENNDDEVEEEEEVIVYANFEEGTVDREIFQNTDLKFKAIGLDSDTPIVQLGDQTFKGTWNDTIGTRVFLEEDPSPEQVDPVFTLLPSKMLKYKCMSTKTLDLSRIFLKQKNTEVINELDVQTSKNSNKSADEKLGDEVTDFAQSTVNPDSSISEIVTEIAQVTDLAQSTINPDSSVSEIMTEIVAETVMDITE